MSPDKNNAGVAKPDKREERRKSRPSFILFLWIVVMWQLLWGEVTWANIFGGIGVGLLISIFVPMPRVPVSDIDVHWPSMIKLFATFFVDFIVASFTVAWLAVRRQDPPPSAVVEIPMRTRDDLSLASAIALINLQPGGLAIDIDNRRWAGVPFYLRSAKRMPRRVTEIALVFKSAPHLPFADTMTTALGQNAMVIRVQPDEGVLMRFGSKVPGSTMEVRDVNMDFSYSESFTEQSPEAYERLILDALLDEASLFPTNEEVELSWKILDPVIEYWGKRGRPDENPAGTWGPESAARMLEREGRTWRRP